MPRFKLANDALAALSELGDVELDQADGGDEVIARLWAIVSTPVLDDAGAPVGDRYGQPAVDRAHGDLLGQASGDEDGEAILALAEEVLGG